jgi:L-ascorbate metabolism protein UlaG (beta-lactamase superfamily)
MRKFLVIMLGAILVLIIAVIALRYAEREQINSTTSTPMTHITNPVQVTPISHATAVLTWGDTVIYTDPVGGAAAFSGQPAPTVIVVTDIHSDHFSTDTLDAITGSADLIVPQAVKDMLSPDLAARAKVLRNGDTISVHGLNIEAIPMYNIPESTSSFHTKGRGNGYVLERDSYRIYIAGDTSGTSEMRALTGIDMAFIPMNLPYTMSVEEAAETVLSFKPKIVYPYHYRGPNGLADINHFKDLVSVSNSNIDVRLLNWYPGQ